MTTILYLGQNHSDQTATISIDGVQYEYWFLQRSYLSVIEHLAHRVSLGKALAFAKKHAVKCERVRQ